MAGRVLRRCPDVAVKNVVQCADTRHPFTATAPAAAQYLQVGTAWRSIGTNQRVDEVATRMLGLLVATSRREAAPAGAARGGAARGPGGLRRMKPWNYRAAEAADRFARRDEQGAAFTTTEEPSDDDA